MIRKIKKAIKKNFFRSMQEEDINFEQLQEKIKAGAILLDVRSIQEYKENHLKGAIQLSDYEINKKASTILKDKKQEIVVYCQNGGRSKRAYKALKKLGYENVYNLYGGMENI